MHEENIPCATMDVDTDIDAHLLQRFSSMGTTDREVLIAEFQKLLGNQLNPTGCEFFLDMNNWNLQAAICSYYDCEQPKQEKIPCMTLIKDVTIGDGEAVPPRTPFLKTWRIQNSGQDSWPPGCCLKFLQGDLLEAKERVMVDALQPGQVTEISIGMISPDQAGLFQSQWRMCTATGMFFGEVIWSILQVAEGGLLGLTQQMSRIGSEFNIPNSPPKPLNPFGQMNTSFDDMGSSPRGSPNYSILAQHGSPDTSIHNTSLLNASFSTSSPIRTALFPSSIPEPSSPTAQNEEDESMIS